MKAKLPVQALLGGVLGLLLALPYYLASAQMWSAFKVADAPALEAAVQKWPQDVINMTTADKYIADAGNVPGAIKLLNQANEQSPDSVYPLKLLYDLTPNTDPSKAVIKSKIDRLDTYYFEILQRTK